MPQTYESTALSLEAAGDTDDLQGLLRTSDVAALFQVSSRTVSEWARRGRVPCMRTPGGQWRYPAEPIRKLLNRPEERFAN
jgi:excisionase family DNA binding protein